MWRAASRALARRWTRSRNGPTLGGMGIFLAAVFFLLITPGPGVLSVAGNGAAYGFRAGAPYLIGVVLGSLVVIAANIAVDLVYMWLDPRIEIR